MKWRSARRSKNVIDRRGQSAGRGRVAVGGGGLGVLAIVLIGWFLGIDLSPIMGVTGQGGAVQPAPRSQVSAADEERAAFTSAVLGYTEEIWSEIFTTQLGQTYTPPQLVLFSGQLRAGACGLANAATGPFYCPADKLAYLDTDFFVTLDQQLGAGGDFAAAYVIAHEVAHHVQNELGILGEANRVRAQVSEAESNAISVRIELQADCYSGVWARMADERYGILERGDIREAMNAAARIGDDTLQRNAGQRVRPDSFTHGTAQQRQTWFARGFETQDLRSCDTFSARL